MATKEKRSIRKAGAQAVKKSPQKSDAQPRVGVIMGSQSDWATMRFAAETLESLGVAHEVKIVSAHRTPKRLYDYAQGAKGRGLKVIVAGAGGAAHLPGMTASLTELPVLGVPVESQALKGQDSLLSIVQMPAGIPVGTLAIGKAGAINAALLAAAVLALNDAKLARRLAAYRQRQTDAVAPAPKRED
jgi:5-(carboxyamino)imidazole ribonucleotide mutase